MKVLVVGSNGFLGRSVVKKCLEKGWIVECVYYKQKNFIPKKCKSFFIDELFKQDNNYDVIFLLAAHVLYANYDVANRTLLESNIKLPLKIIEKFPKSKIIFSSSVSVYGKHTSIISEYSAYNNPNLYGLLKLNVETLLQFHPNYQIVRFSSVYGEGMNNTTFVPHAIQEAKESKKITIFGDGSRLQDYLYIDDAAEYCIKAADRKESGIYLGVNGKSYSNIQVAKIIQKLIPDCKIKFRDRDSSPSFMYDNTLSRKLLHFTPSFTLESGLRKVMKSE